MIMTILFDFTLVKNIINIWRKYGQEFCALFCNSSFTIFFGAEGLLPIFTHLSGSSVVNTYFFQCSSRWFLKLLTDVALTVYNT